MQEGIVFTNRNNDFATVLKDRVDAYFRGHGLSKKNNWLMRTKTCFYLGGFVMLYALVMFAHLPAVAMFGLALLLGLFISGIGFNIGHDAVHGAYSSRPWVNRLMSHAFDLVGASSYTWRIRHNVLHHTYTNIIGSDGDLESIPLLRFYLKPGRKFYHRFQHWYAPFLYGFITLVWVLKKDYLHIWEERQTQHVRRKPPPGAYVSLISFKLMHYTLFIGLPLFVLQLPIWQVGLGFFAMHFIAGVSLAFVFQLAHVVEGPALVRPTDLHTISDSWAVHQIKTTANFGPDFITTWICGGLNFQIEHHLFPSICHVHYPALSPIVQMTAKEFDLPYYHYKSFFSAFRSHLRLLKYYGRADPVLIS